MSGCIPTTRGGQRISACGEDVEVATAPQAFAPPTEPVQVSDPAPAARILFVRIPRGWFGDWHATPKRQFNTTIEGQLEITMSDGESRVFGAWAAVRP